jgi:hypothetical protein
MFEVPREFALIYEDFDVVTAVLLAWLHPQASALIGYEMRIGQFNLPSNCAMVCLFKPNYIDAGSFTFLNFSYGRVVDF